MYMCVCMCVCGCVVRVITQKGMCGGVTVCVGCVCVYVIMHVRVYECTRVCVCAEM